jgi:hypothetical protein
MGKLVRWDPLRDRNDRFYHRSAALEAFYYQMQITIHRPFIPLANKRSSVSFPSLEICTNAARAISNVIGIQSEGSEAPYPWQIVGDHPSSWCISIDQ